MRFLKGLLQCLLVVAMLAVAVIPAAAKEATGGYQTGFTFWRGSDGRFAGWTLSGVSLTGEGSLTLDPATAVSGSDPYAAGAYYSGNFYNAGNFKVGEATSPVLPVTFDFKEAIASWNASTPAGSWIELQVRAQIGDRWSKWYNLGIWAETYDVIERHSVRLQGDADGYVAVDTLVLSSKSKVAANALQLMVRLFQDEYSTALPVVRSISLAYSQSAPKKVSQPSAGNPLYWDTLLSVPECSQMVYPDGGNVWCSPTSTSMVLGFNGYMPGECEPRVREAVDRVYDWIYDGHGNWPFNTAYAASIISPQPMEAYVARYSSLEALEPWIAAGVPVVMSIAWKKSDLEGAAVASSDGHLVVLVGFDAAGSPIVNDPAAATNEDVQRTYIRSELETVWQINSGGTVYLIFPVGQAVPEF